MPDMDGARRVPKLTNSPRKICPNNRSDSRDILTDDTVCGNDQYSAGQIVMVVSAVLILCSDYC